MMNGLRGTQGPSNCAAASIVQRGTLRPSKVYLICVGPEAFQIPDYFQILGHQNI